MGHGHGECTEQGVAESDLRPTGEPLLERQHRAVQAEAADETTHQSADEQCDDHMHPAHGEDEHEDHGEQHGIHVRDPTYALHTFRSSSCGGTLRSVFQICAQSNWPWSTDATSVAVTWAEGWRCIDPAMRV